MNTTFAAQQPPYLPLPAWRGDHRQAGDEGEVISCWSLTWRERIHLLWTGRLWLRQLTFGAALQPQRPQIARPFV